MANAGMDNDKRAEKISRILGLKGNDTDTEYYRVADVLTDLRHYCDKMGVDFDDEADMAVTYYESEREEELYTKSQQKETHGLADYPTYALDDDTQQLLESAMNLAQRVIDLQEDDETAEQMQWELEDLALRFKIQRARIVTTETPNEDGSVDINIKLEPDQEPKPKLTVIEGNKEDSNVTPFPRKP